MSYLMMLLIVLCTLSLAVPVLALYLINYDPVTYELYRVPLAVIAVTLFLTGFVVSFFL